MKLLEFWEEISLMPDAVRQLEKLEITEGEYEKLRELFLRDVNLFYEAVKKREDFRLVFLYCFSKMACEVYDRYCEQGISRRVYRDTFYDLTLWCENCYKAYGEYGIAQYDWFCRHLDMSLFRLGRLEFERIPSLWEIQTDGISVHKGDPVISVHIPQGEKLELDACLDSFRQAEQFWKEKQVYLCHSWLLYPGLKEIMKPESNILQFQTLFHIVAVDFEGREAEERIFGELETDPRSYAEDTSLQRAARKYLLSGEKLGSGLGVWTGEEKDANTADHIHTWIQEHTEELVNTADYIFRHPELSKEEVVSSACLSDYLEEKGFRITKGIAGLQTAFAAEWGSGQPILGFLAEYDALPGLGQKPVCTYQPLKTPGHGCGHNLLGTACAGAACALKEAMETSDLPGTIWVYGCPAEEIIIGKIQMNEAGVFDDLDAAITWHPFDRNRVSYDIWQAQDMKNYKFYGVKAHASKHPELGRSALDAAELMNVGVNYLREHVADDVRIHYTYTNTDGPANIVPDFASTNYFIRSSKRSRTEDASRRVDDCAKGAALMTGTRVEIELVTSNQEMKVNRPLAEVFYQAMEQTNLPEYTEEELRFAESLTKEAGLVNDGNYFGGLEPLEDQPVLLAIGTDVSEVSHTVPTVMLSAATMCKGTPLHHWSAAAQSGMSIGQKGMLYVTECMAKGALRLIEEPELLTEAWRVHQE